MSQQVIGIALPQFLFDKANQIWLLSALFIMASIIPFKIIDRKPTLNSLEELTFSNGIQRLSQDTMTKMLLLILERNIRKKQSLITSE